MIDWKPDNTGGYIGKAKNKLKVNKVKCLKCNKVIESKRENDSKTCDCMNVFIDGGLTKARRVVVNIKKFKELSEQ